MSLEFIDLRKGFIRIVFFSCFKVCNVSKEAREVTERERIPQSFKFIFHHLMFMVLCDVI